MLRSRFVLPNRGIFAAVSRSSSIYSGPATIACRNKVIRLVIRPVEFSCLSGSSTGNHNRLGNSLQNLADIGLFDEMIEAQLDQVALSGGVEQVGLGQFSRDGSDGDAQHGKISRFRRSKADAQGDHDEAWLANE